MSPRARQGNRTDLATDTPAKLAVTSVPDQQYGAAGVQRAAQAEVPMGSPDTPAAPMIPLAQSVQHALPKAGSLPFLQPTNRPNEPVTEGVPFGDGANSLHTPVLPSRPISAAFDELAQSSNGSTAVSNLADTARLLGL